MKKINKRLAVLEKVATATQDTFHIQIVYYDARTGETFTAPDDTASKQIWVATNSKDEVGSIRR